MALALLLGVMEAKMTTQLHPKLKQLNTLFKEIQADKAAYPETKIGYYYSVPSILNAYREGDLSYDDACALLQVKPEVLREASDK